MANDLMTRYVIPAPKEDGGFVTTDDLTDAHHLATVNEAASFTAEVYREQDPTTVLRSETIKTVETTEPTEHEHARRKQAEIAAAKLKSLEVSPPSSVERKNVGVAVAPGTRHSGDFPDPVFPVSHGERDPAHEEGEVIPNPRPETGGATVLSTDH